MEFKDFESYSTEIDALVSEVVAPEWSKALSQIPKDAPTYSEEEREKNSKKWMEYYTSTKERTIAELVDEMTTETPNEEANLWDNVVARDICEMLAEVTKQFEERVRRYDPSLDLPSKIQAVRTLWLMIAFQRLIGLEAVLNSAMFGYVMLYPYTDNLVDDTSLSKAEKDGFFERGRKRLFGELRESTSESERKVFDMVDEIESQWPREEYPSLYHSLVKIHDAQRLSLKQHPSGDYEPSHEFLHQIPLQKGGASVVAACYAPAGRLTAQQIVFLQFLGVSLQLIDDAQDIEEDSSHSRRTLFTESAHDPEDFDDITLKLLHFIYHPVLRLQFDGEDALGETPTTVRRSAISFMTVLVLEAVSKNIKRHTPAILERLEELCPLTFDVLSKIGLEQTLFKLLLKWDV